LFDFSRKVLPASTKDTLAGREWLHNNPETGKLPNAGAIDKRVHFREAFAARSPPLSDAQYARKPTRIFTRAKAVLKPPPDAGAINERAHFRASVLECGAFTAAFGRAIRQGANENLHPIQNARGLCTLH